MQTKVRRQRQRRLAKSLEKGKEHMCLSELQSWFSSQCDGEWEHDVGVRITTLDNPGWMMTVNLKGTNLETYPDYETKEYLSEEDWVYSNVKNHTFLAAGDQTKLAAIISIFVRLLPPPNAKSTD